MGYLPSFTHPDFDGSPSASHYRDLLAQSAAARERGDHPLAQRMASAAHKWAMDEIARLQRLQLARAALDQAQKQLDTAWDHDRECATVVDLRERHPEYRAVITRWETAEAQVRGLDAVVPDVVVAQASPRDSRRTLPPRRFVH